MAKSFSDQERETIKAALITECQSSWEKFGYKKTGIDELCTKAGISKGAFYLFFDSKESLFYETIVTVQQKLYHMIEDIMQEEQSKYGVVKALKAVYKVYDTSSFLYDITSSDFVGFLNKLTAEQKENVTVESYIAAKRMIDKPYLKLQISEEKALSVLSMLLFMIAEKDKIICNHFEVFDFMLVNLIDKIFE
jgi:AcrR family transcriptional regulator